MKLFVSSLDYCMKKFSSQKEIDARCDYLYGARLSKYINDKNINGIQITKKEYTMNLKNENIAEYDQFNKLDAETIEILRKKDFDVTDEKQLHEFCKLANINIY